LALAVSGLMCFLRSPGQLNSNLRKLAVNMILFGYCRAAVLIFMVGFVPLAGYIEQVAVVPCVDGAGADATDAACGMPRT
jgi:hypothetical protein